MIKVTAGDWDGVAGFGEEELRKMKPAAEALMYNAGTRFQAELKKQLSGTRSGRTYKVSKTGKLHVASAPGESPAVLFGALRNSMGFSKPRWKGFTVEMEVGSGLGVGRPKNDKDARTSKGYAMRMEYGGYSFHPWPVYIAPRPYMAPVAVRMEPILHRLFEAGL